MQDLRPLVAFAVLALVAVVAAWIAVRPTTELDDAIDRAEAVERARSLRLDAAGDGLADTDLDTDYRPARPAPQRRASGDEGGGGAHGDEADGEEFLYETDADRIERGVMTLLGKVAPELDPGEVRVRCTGAASPCFFRGPWPGDDFLSRWLEAIGRGDVATEDLDGVVFKEFKPIERRDGTKGFRIRAETR